MNAFPVKMEIFRIQTIWMTEPQTVRKKEEEEEEEEEEEDSRNNTLSFKIDHF